MDTRLEAIYGPDRMGITADDVNAWGGVATGILSGLTQATRTVQTSPTVPGTSVPMLPAPSPMISQVPPPAKQTNFTPWLIGGAVLVAGAIGLYLYNGKKKKGKRRK